MEKVQTVGLSVTVLFAHVQQDSKATHSFVVQEFLHRQLYDNQLHHYKQLIHVFHLHVDLIRIAEQLDPHQLVPVVKDLSVHHQTVDMSVYLTTSAHQFMLVFNTNAETHAEEHVAMMLNVGLSITHLFAHAFQALKVIHSVVARESEHHLHLLNLVTHALFVDLMLVVNDKESQDIVNANQSISEILMLDVNQNVYSIPIVHLIKLVEITNALTLVLERAESGQRALSEVIPRYVLVNLVTLAIRLWSVE